jgi:hypothetical protein
VTEYQVNSFFGWLKISTYLFVLAKIIHHLDDLLIHAVHNLVHLLLNLFDLFVKFVDSRDSRVGIFYLLYPDDAHLVILRLFHISEIEVLKRYVVEGIDLSFIAICDPIELLISCNPSGSDRLFLSF